MFAVSENMRTFVMPRNTRTTKSECYIFNREYKAGVPFGQFYFGSLVFLGRNEGASASFVIYLPNFFPKMPRNEKVSGAVKDSTRTASTEQQSYSQLKRDEKTYRVVVFGGILVHGQGFGHSISYFVSAINESQAVSMALRKYSRRKYSLPIQEARVTLVGDSQACLTAE